MHKLALERSVRLFEVSQAEKREKSLKNVKSPESVTFLAKKLFHMLGFEIS